MLKDKYLHRKYGRTHDDRYVSKKHKKEKNVDLFSDDLPFHNGVGKKYKTGYDLKPLVEFVESKVGCDWNDVYSEILTKINNKVRYNIDQNIMWWVIKTPIYDEDYIPRDRRGTILNDQLFIDMDNIIRKYSTEENISNSKRYMRREKIRQMLENIKKEEEKDE